MDTNDESTSVPRRAWYEVKLPALYLIIGVLLVSSATVGIVAEGRSVLSSAVSFFAGALFFLVASLTLLRRVRNRQPVIDQGPLAQESDPRLRSTR